MTPEEELFVIAERLEGVGASSEFAAAEEALCAADDVAMEASRAFSGSWLGYHACVYYRDLAPPPPGAHFSQEWGLQDMSYTSLGSRGEWYEFDTKELELHLWAKAGNPDLSALETAAVAAMDAFNAAKAEIRSIILTKNAEETDVFLTQLLAELDKIRPLTGGKIASIWSPKGQVMTRDTVAIGQGNRLPPMW